MKSNFGQSKFMAVENFVTHLRSECAQALGTLAHSQFPSPHPSLLESIFKYFQQQWKVKSVPYLAPLSKCHYFHHFSDSSWDKASLLIVLVHENSAWALFQSNLPKEAASHTTVAVFFLLKTQINSHEKKFVGLSLWKLKRRIHGHGSWHKKKRFPAMIRLSRNSPALCI